MYQASIRRNPLVNQTIVNAEKIVGSFEDGFLIELVPGKKSLPQGTGCDYWKGLPCHGIPQLGIGRTKTILKDAFSWSRTIGTRMCWNDHDSAQ